MAKNARFYVITAVSVVFALIVIFGSGIIIKTYLNEKKLVRFETEVVKVFDGDTILISEGSRKVRLKGIDTPELHHPDLPVQDFAEEARDYLEKRVMGKKVIIEYNKEDMHDIYGRVLAYVYVGEDMVNAELVKKGLATVYRKKDCLKTKDFNVLETVAKKFRRGIWEHGQAGQVKP